MHYQYGGRTADADRQDRARQYFRIYWADSVIEYSDPTAPKPDIRAVKL